MLDKEIIEKILQWKEEEENYAKILENTKKLVKSPILKLILSVASLDSHKHSVIYDFIEKTIKENKESFIEKESEIVLKELENHIKEEAEAMEFLVKYLNNEEVKNNKFLEFAFKLIYKDEILHHILLHDTFNALININNETMKELYESIDKWLKCS